MSSTALGWSGIQADHYRGMTAQPDGFELPGMTHHMLNFILDGHTGLDVAWDGIRYSGVIRAGEASLVPAHRPARWRWGQTVPECFHVFLDPTLLARTIEDEWDRDPSSVDLVSALRFTDPALLGLAHSLRDELLQGEPGGRLLAESAAAMMAVHLLRRNSTLSEPMPRTRGGALAPWRLRRAVELVEASLDRQVGLSELASAAGLSEGHFARAFRAATGESPYAYAVRHRLERAQALLMSQPDLPVAEVAAACGFADQAHLTTAFRRITGLPPAAWRRARLR